MVNAGAKPGAAARGDEPADSVLLERFTTQREEAAFAALVQRHGPMVLGVCRRLLQHEQDAEDVFQAVFCVFARKAHTVRSTAVAGWLYAVACRIARNAKAVQVRQRMRERPLPDVAAPDHTPEQEWRELWPILDEELNRLPAHYRQAFVLCHLEGKSGQEAAAVLRCPEGTVTSRLTRARRRLSARLERRGFGLSAAALEAAINRQTTAAAVPPELARRAVETGLDYSTGRPIAQRPADLANGFLRILTLTRWLRITGLLALAFLMVGAALWFTLGRKAPSDLELLQGTWNVTLVRAGGQQMPEPGVTMSVSGERVTLRTPNMMIFTCLFRVDPSKEPKQIDHLFGRGVTWPGIYRLQGDRLQLCLNTQGGERPTDLNEERFAYYELRRIPAGPR
jgi:RNA polymerase sigma factor (sigma-70 family)